MPNATLEIAKREFLEHVLSWRFLIAAVLSTLILVTSVVALAATYKEDLDAYSGVQDQLAQADDGFSQAMLQLHRHIARPNVLSIFVGGAGDDYRAEVAESMTGPGAGPFSIDAGSGSPTNRRFDPLDLGFVAVVVMTFMAVIFSFDAVSGEKERGTLKLVLANPVPKDSILLGKYLGGLASILLPLGISTMLGLAALSLTGLTLPPGAWARLAVIVVLMVLLLSAFYLVGLLVSSLSRRSSTSLLALTLVWLLLVFGTGNVAAVIAKGTTDTTTNAELQEANREINDRLQAEIEPRQEEMMGLFQKQQRGNLTDAERQRLQQLQQEQSAAFEAAEAEREELRRTSMRQLDDQLRRAEAIASVSPAEAFRGLATAIARSDYWSLREATDAGEEYRREVDRTREEWEEDNPQTGPRVMIVGPGGFRSGTGDDFEPPAFHYQPASLSQQLSSPAAVRNALVLLAYNLGAFVAAYVAFLRYDVR